MRVLLIADPSDDRRRWRFVEDALAAAGASCTTETFENAQSLTGDYQAAIVFHGGAATAKRVQQLKQTLACPVVLRLGGRNDKSALDRAATSLKRLQISQSCRALANVVMDKHALRSADGSICVTPELATWAQKRSGRPAIWAPPARPHLGDEAASKQSAYSHKILTVANLRYRAKATGLARLLPHFERIAATDSRVRWRIAGDLSQHRDVQRTLRASPHSASIQLLGWCPSIQELLRSANQFWYASSYDSYPLVISEAMWHGIPILTRQGEPAAAMLPADVPLAGDEAWIERSLQLLHDANLHASMASACRSHVERVECAATVGARIVTWLRELKG